jgi:hypothetical protein
MPASTVQSQLWGQHARRPAKDPVEPMVGKQRAERPSWCGSCDERTRLIERPEDGGPYRCPACHPLTGSQQEASAEPTDDDLAAARFRREADRLTEWQLAQRRASL